MLGPQLPRIRDGAGTTRVRSLFWALLPVIVVGVVVVLSPNVALLVLFGGIYLLWHLAIDPALTLVLVLSFLGSAAWCWPRRRPGRWRRLAGRAIALVVLLCVVNALWFRFGWMPLRPLCFVGGFVIDSHIEMMGRMRPEVSETFHDTLRDRRGGASVTFGGPSGVLVRPALRVLATKELERLTNRITFSLAGGDLSFRDAGRCDAVEARLMSPAAASERSRGWGYAPYNLIDEQSSLARWLVGYHERLDPADAASP